MMFEEAQWLQADSVRTMIVTHPARQGGSAEGNDVEESGNMSAE